MGIQERKEREKEQRRQDIITAAEKLFFTKGLDNTTVDEIAAEAELSKGTVYLYFKGKEDLQFSVLQRGADILQDMLKAVISANESGLKNLLEMGHAFIRFSKEYKNYFQIFMFFQTSNFAKLNIAPGELQHYFVHRSPFAILAEIVQKGIDDGSLRADIPAPVLATTLWSQIIGLMTVLENKRELHRLYNIEQQDILNTHFELLVNGGKNNSRNGHGKK
ncbi:MAG: TetR/AcrR family transcriptional regulator [Bacteroidetes bacterium]|nr:TetR/AcrR family transcriptional regulator [Bacteroidota bacterium]